MNWRPDIFEYLSYRKFMLDYYTTAKQHMKRFSHRFFSQQAGFTSSNFLKMVMDGDRNLSPESAIRVAQAMGLSAAETRFFVLLVDFEQASDPDERARIMESIAATRRFLEAKPIDGMLYEYLTNWFNLAIRELAGRSDFQDDPAWIAEQLRPKISTNKAQKSLELLLELGLLERENGRITRGEPSLDAGHEVQVVGVRQFHRQMLERAAASIDDVPANERDISAITVCVRSDSVADLKAKLRDFRERFMASCDEQEDPDVVYQMNVQLFPLSQSRKP
ncbi:MAG: TIGR02147 family protein [bacterium]